MQTHTIHYCVSFISRLLFRAIQTAAIFLIIMILPGCINYYQIHATKEASPIDTIPALQKTGKQFIIHLKDTAFSLVNSSISDDTLKGNLLPLNEIQLKYLHPGSRIKNNYSKEHEYEVLNEVHLYTTNAIINLKTGSNDSLKFSFPFSSVFRIDINEKNTRATKRSETIGTLIVTAVLVTAIIIAVTSIHINILGNGKIF